MTSLARPVSGSTKVVPSAIVLPSGDHRGSNRASCVLSNSLGVWTSEPSARNQLNHVAGVETTSNGVWILVAGQKVKLHPFRIGEQERLAGFIREALGRARLVRDSGGD